jgi:hypothetical protein
MESTLALHRYNTRYDPLYTGRGPDGLIDGLRGGADFRTGDWQGFQGADLDVVIDLGAEKAVSTVTTGFLQDENAWIFFPLKMRVETSLDGQQFSSAGETTGTVPPEEKGVVLRDFSVNLNGRKARYIRVVGQARGQCPDTHKGAGNPCWVFADEILIE